MTKGVAELRSTAEGGCRYVWGEKGFMGANYKASRPMSSGRSGDREARRTIRRPQDRKSPLSKRKFQTPSSRRVASSSLRKKSGGFTSFIFAEFRVAQRRTSSRVPKPPASSCPTSETSSTSTRTRSSCSIRRRNRQAPPPNHASGAVHDRHILQAFDLKSEFHLCIHTNLP